MGRKKLEMVATEAFSNCTVSKVGLAMKCVHWAWARVRDDGSDAAELGTMYHELVSTGALREKGDDHLRYLAQELFLNQPFEFTTPTVRHEIAFQVRPERGFGRGDILLGVRDREYPDHLGLQGTIDLWEPGAWVGDLKTGEFAEYHKRQVEAAAFALGVRECRLYYIYEINNVVRCKLDVWSLDDSQFHDLSVALRDVELEILAGSEENKPPIRGGEHCESHWCKLRKKCPGSPAMKAIAGDE